MVKIVKVTAEEAARRLASITDDKRFWVSDGKVLASLDELESALGDMSDDTYSYHCNEFKCDFTNWVRDVIGDVTLAKDLGETFNRDKAAKIVQKRVAWLKGKLTS